MTTYEEEPLVHIRPINDFEKNLFLEYWNEKLVEEIEGLRERVDEYEQLIQGGVSSALKENKHLRERNKSLRKTNDELIIKILRLRGDV